MKFFEFCGLYSCLKPRPSRLKQFNCEAFKLLADELADADEDTNKAVNSLLQAILHKLSATFPTSKGRQMNSLCRGEHIDRQALRIFLLAVKSHPLDVSVWNLSISQSRKTHVSNSQNGPVDSSIPRQQGTGRLDNYQSLAMTGPVSASEQYLRQIVQRSTPSQLELLLKLEAVVNWRQCVAYCGLATDLPPGSPGLPPDISLVSCSVKRSGRLRIGSWNLKQFTLEKAKHPGFRETVCLTILRCQLSLVVLQEVAHLDVANLLCAELNNPTLPHVKEWLARRGSFAQPRRWGAATSLESTGLMFQGHEYAIYLYNSASGVDISRTSVLRPPATAAKYGPTSKHFSRNPCSALCQVRSSRFVIVSVHLKAQGKRGKCAQKTAAEVHNLGALIVAFNETQPAGSHLIVLGDFNLYPEHPSFNVLRSKGMSNVLSGVHSTTVSSVGKSAAPRCRAALDNAWLSSGLSYSGDFQPSDGCCFTNNSGVIAHGLRHPLIPNGTGAGTNGYVSDHCPIWFDLYLP